MKAEFPDYSLRRSGRARNLRLKVTRDEGLIVVVPRGYDERKVPALLNQKKMWITDALKRVGEAKRFLEPKPQTHLPETVRLLALGKTCPVIYQVEARSGIRLREENGMLVMSGADLTRGAVVRKLKDWLRAEVREGLFPLAEKLAIKHGLPINKLLVKSQRTRWASCSARKNLSLNTKLLFLPPDLVRYVLIHELCHTVHLNHGQEFWRLVALNEPEYRILDSALRGAWKTLPQWVF